VARTTLGERFRGKHTTRKSACESRQLITAAEEKVLLEWMDLSAMQGRPYDRQDLRAAVFDLCGKTPGKNWCKRFHERHADKLALAKASSLDPTQGKNFNRPTIQDYFQVITDIEKEHGEIPPEQKWNEDEKALQLGGGRKHGRRKFFFLKKRRNRYKLRNDNLELVTVLECVSAAGVAAPTSFVLKTGPFPDIRGVENVGWYALKISETSLYG
jgi:hypothetical protein